MNKLKIKKTSDNLNNILNEIKSSPFSSLIVIFGCTDISVIAFNHSAYFIPKYFFFFKFLNDENGLSAY